MMNFTKFLAGFVAVGVIGGGLCLIPGQLAEAKNPDAAPKTQDAAVVPHSETVLDTAFTVKSGEFLPYKFSVPVNAKQVKVNGHFEASGGSKNSIEVFITNEDGLANLKNKNHYKIFYSSGRVTQDTLKVSLPSSADTYYLIFDNRFPLAAAKAVKANATVSYVQ
jgi:hypothetical protein